MMIMMMMITAVFDIMVFTRRRQYLASWFMKMLAPSSEYNNIVLRDKQRSRSAML